MSLCKKTLRDIMDAMATLLHPDITRQVLRRIGAKHGAAAAREYRKTHTTQQPFSKENYVSCIENLGRHWDCGYRKIEEGRDYLVFHVSTCPFREVGTHNPNVCPIESGVFGRIASAEFGYAKVCIFRKEGSPPRDCRVIVHIKKTKESLAAEGSVYPEDRGGVYDLPEGQSAEPPLLVLSTREREVLGCMGEGLSDKEIAATLNVSVRTAENHAAQIRAKLKIRKRAELVRYALRHRLATI